MKSLCLILLFLSGFAQDPPEKIRVAVVPFKNNTGDATLNVSAASTGESIATALAAIDGLVIIERAQIDKALTEQDFQWSDNVDPTTSQTLGKLVGAEYLIIGDLQKTGSRLRINARRIRVIDGVVLEGASVDGDDDTLFDLQDEIAEKLVALFVPQED